MTVEIKDILLKAAEDVQQGMWCKVSWFAPERDEAMRGDGEVFDDRNLFGLPHGATEAEAVRSLRVDQELLKRAVKSYRCAEGSIALSTALLGGTYGDYRDAVSAIEDRSGEALWALNDGLLDDPFEAGQQLAELFRSTAEAL